MPVVLIRHGQLVKEALVVGANVKDLRAIGTVEVFNHVEIAVEGERVIPAARHARHEELILAHAGFRLLLVHDDNELGDGGIGSGLSDTV